MHLLLSLQDELTLEGYRKHLESEKAEPPLTDAERELKEMHEAEVSHMGVCQEFSQGV